MNPGGKNYKDLFRSVLDQIKSGEDYMRRVAEYAFHRGRAPRTRKKGSKRPESIVRAERRRKNKAAKQARKLNRRGKSRPKGRRKK